MNMTVKTTVLYESNIFIYIYIYIYIAWKNVNTLSIGFTTDVLSSIHLLNHMLVILFVMRLCCCTFNISESN
jgi:hypothetical protein